MSGYRDFGQGYLPPHKRDRPRSRKEWIAGAIGIFLGLFLMVASGSEMLGIRSLFGLESGDRSLLSTLAITYMFASIPFIAGRDHAPGSEEARRTRFWSHVMIGIAVVMTAIVAAFIIFDI